MTPKIDMTKFRYVLDNKFKINIKTKIKIRVSIMFIEINNSDFE